MIYQHRLVVARPGELDARNEIFEKGAKKELDEHGSLLLGAWEIVAGKHAQAAVIQLRQFDSMAAWETHQSSVAAAESQLVKRSADLYPAVESCTTAILRASGRSPQPEPTDGPDGFYLQRIFWIAPAEVAAHRALYFDRVVSALDICDSTLVGYFDTVIGPGSTNGGSHRSVELRRFPNARAWESWVAAQTSDPGLRALVRHEFSRSIRQTETFALRPLRYSLLK